MRAQFVPGESVDHLQNAVTTRSRDHQEGPLDDDDPAWSRRESARLRQILIGKARPEYRRYLSEVAKSGRGPLHPCTPNPRARVSKRQFDRALCDWRRRLHEYEASSDSSTALPHPTAADWQLARTPPAATADRHAADHAEAEERCRSKLEARRRLGGPFQQSATWGNDGSCSQRPGEPMPSTKMLQAPPTQTPLAQAHASGIVCLRLAEQILKDDRQALSVDPETPPKGPSRHPVATSALPGAHRSRVPELTPRRPTAPRGRSGQFSSPPPPMLRSLGTIPSDPTTPKVYNAQQVADADRSTRAESPVCMPYPGTMAERCQPLCVQSMVMAGAPATPYRSGAWVPKTPSPERCYWPAQHCSTSWATQATHGPQGLPLPWWDSVPPVPLSS